MKGIIEIQTYIQAGPEFKEWKKKLIDEENIKSVNRLDTYPGFYKVELQVNEWDPMPTYYITDEASILGHSIGQLGD